MSTQLPSGQAIDAYNGSQKIRGRNSPRSAQGRTNHEVQSLWFQCFDRKIRHGVRQRPEESYKFIHARYPPYTWEELPGGWGHKQRDILRGGRIGQADRAPHIGLHLLTRKFDTNCQFNHK